MAGQPPEALNQVPLENLIAEFPKDRGEFERISILNELRRVTGPQFERFAVITNQPIGDRSRIFPEYVIFFDSEELVTLGENNAAVNLVDIEEDVRAALLLRKFGTTQS